MVLFSLFRFQNDLKSLILPVEIVRNEDFLLEFAVKFHSAIYTKKYTFKLTFTKEYPFKSPKLLCLTNTYHPNIYDTAVCLKVLREGWKPVYDLNSIIASLYEVFENLSYEDAFNTEAGELLEYDKNLFIEKVKEVEV
ncbi:hypothetical protein NUSPORA_02865 [Nucleospora cyclopteri]